MVGISSNVFSYIGVLAAAWIGLYILYKIAQHLLSKIELRGGLEGKAILITGCDTGIGKLMALHFAKEEGLLVFASCLTEDGQRSLNEESGGKVLTFLMDVTDDDSVQSAKKFVDNNLGGKLLHGVVNNAGVGPGGHMELMPVSEYEQTFKVNLFGVVRVTKAFLPLLVQSRGRVVNHSTTAALVPLSGMSDYGVSKLALGAFGDVLRREVRGFGVKISTLCPGPMKTPIFELIAKRVDKNFQLSDADVQSRYGGEEVYRTFWQGNIRKMVMASGRPDQVLPPVRNALISRFPKAVYMIGLDANFLCWPATFLPEWLLDSILAYPAPKS